MGVTAVSGRRAFFIGLTVAVLAILGFALAEAFHVKLFVDPGSQMPGRGLTAGLGVGLLVADIVLPVPSSIVMVAHGALFGVVPGAALSLLGRTGNAVAGVALGRGAGRLVGPRSTTGQGRGAALVDRWGLAAVVLTRPVPVLAESTVVAAGAMGLSAPAVVAAATVGAVPEAVIYAVAGDRAASSSGAAVVFVAVLALAAGIAAAGARLDARRRQAAGDGLAGGA